MTWDGTTLSFSGTIRPKRKLAVEAFLLSWTGLGSFKVVTERDNATTNEFTFDSSSITADGQSVLIPGRSGGVSAYVTPTHVDYVSTGSHADLGAVSDIVEVDATGVPTGNWYIEGTGTLTGASMLDARVIPGEGYYDPSTYCYTPTWPQWQNMWRVYDRVSRPGFAGKFFFDAQWTGDDGLDGKLSYIDQAFVNEEIVRQSTGGTCPPTSYEIERSAMALSGPMVNDVGGCILGNTTLPAASGPSCGGGTTAIATSSYTLVGGDAYIKPGETYFRCRFVATISVGWSQSYNNNQYSNPFSCAWNVDLSSSGTAQVELTPTQLDAGFNLTATGVEVRDSNINDTSGCDFPACLLGGATPVSHRDTYNQALAATFPAISATWDF